MSPMASVTYLDSGEVDGLEMFCGYGGAAQGIEAAGARVHTAINHDDMAVLNYKTNHQDCNVLQADLSDATNPQIVDARGKKVAGRYIDPITLPRASFVWASPSCRFHSPANAKKIYERGPQGVLDIGFDDEDGIDQDQYANSERSRVTMVCPLRYAAHHHPEVVVVENVVEAAKWGPARDGSTFRWWLHEWEKIGYEHEVLFLNSMFFPPTPQSRDRMYVVFWRRGNTSPDLDFRPRSVCTSDRCQGAHVDAVQTWKPRTRAWPIDRWGKYGSQYFYSCPDCRRPVHPLAWPAYSAIDLSNLGPRLDERPELGMRDLQPDTIDRIERGAMKYWNGPPVVVPAKSTWGGTDQPVTSAMRTQTGVQENGITAAAVPVIVPNRTHGTARSIAEQAATVVGGTIAQGIAGITMPVGGNDHERPGQTRARPAHDPMFTLTGTQGWGFAHMPFITEMRGGGSNERPVLQPAATATGGGFHHALTMPPAAFAKFNGGPDSTAWHPLSDPCNSVTTRDTHGLIVLPWIEQWRSAPAAITDQLATVMTHLRHSLVSMEPRTKPLTREERGQVRFRMLEPDPELRFVCGYAADYILLGNKRQMTRGLGDSVSPPVSAAITDRCLATLRGTDDRYTTAAAA